MPAALTLRRADIADAAALAAFAARAFHDTYDTIDDPHDVAEHVALHLDAAAVARWLDDPHATTLLAEAGTALTGYAMLREGDAPDGVAIGPAPIELARLYVDREAIGHGVGATLMLGAHAEAARRGARTLWLGVYERNTRALRFYERFGFAPIGRKSFAYGGRIVSDPVHAAPVRADAADALCAVVLDDYTADRRDELVRLWRESFEHGVGVTDPHPIEEQAAYFDTHVLPRHTVRTAIERGRLVGFVACDGESVAQLHVRVGEHHRGIGSALLRLAQRASGGRLWLYTFRRNTVACRFYEHHGFVAETYGFEPEWKLDDVRYVWTRRDEPHA